jgi:glycosyltransferase involved in cell wall biosynthesis
MRIVIDLQSCQNLSRSRGIGRYSLDMARAILARTTSDDVWVALSDKFPATIPQIRAGLADVISQDRIVVLALPEGTESSDAANAWRTRAAEIVRAAALKCLQPDILFLPSLFEGLWDATVISVEPGPWLTAVTLHDLIPLAYPKEHLGRPQDRDSYARKLQELLKADLLLSVSKFVKDEATRLLGADPARVVHTLEGADKSFRPASLSNAERAALMTRYGISRPFVLNTSPLEFRKNIEGFLAAFAGLEDRVRRAYQAVIVGKMDDEARRYISERARLEGLRKDEVVLTGFVRDEDLVSLYSTCSLFVFPSLSEGFGLPVLEAMACGAPVIASGTTSIPEVVGRSDATFDPTDPGDITRVMRRALVDATYNEELRAWGLRRSVEFSWEQAAGIALSAFEQALSRGKPQPRAAAPIHRKTRPTLAFVVGSASPGARISGYVTAVLPWLATFYEITLVSPSDKSQDPWLSAASVVRDAHWFAQHARGFDRILYCVDEHGCEELADLVAQRPGAVLVQQDPLGPNGILPSRQPSPALQRLIFRHSGFGGLVALFEAGRTGEELNVARGEALACLSRATASIRAWMQQDPW